MENQVGNHPVERRNLRQVVLRITAYAEKLLAGLDDLDWPDSTKRQQKAWIGRSKGAEVRFAIDGSTKDINRLYHPSRYFIWCHLHGGCS